MRSSIGHFFLLVLIILLTGYLYSGGLTNYEFIDDGSNLSGIGINAHNPALLKLEVLENYSGPLGRPVSMLSFAVDAWLNGELSYERAKLVNLAIHGVISLVLFGLLILISSRINFSLTDCLFVAALWLVSPLWVSTVLYAVQRMAQLSCLFMLLSLYCYCRARFQVEKNKHKYISVLFMFLLAVFFLVLGLLSKENAIVAMPLYVVIEIFIFKNLNFDFVSRNKFYLIIAAIAAILLFLLSPALDYILNGYQSRDFTLTERLLTQPRVLMLSMKQLFIPDMSLGLYYDDLVISTSLISSWQTFLSVISLLLICCFIFFSYVNQKFTAIAFGLSWFLVGHSLESSFIALEMYFEHRNYFPSIGLLIAGMAFFKAILTKFDVAILQNRVLVVYIFFQAVLLGVLVSTWSFRYSLYFNALNHHPNSVRAVFNVSTVMASMGGSKEAEALYNKHIKIDDISSNVQRLMFYCVNGEPWTAELKQRSSKSLIELWDGKKAPRKGSPFEELIDQFVLTEKCNKQDVIWLANTLFNISQSEKRSLSGVLYRKLLDVEVYLGRSEYVLYYLDRWEVGDTLDPDILLMRYYYMSLIPESLNSTVLKQDMQKILEKLSQLKLNARQRENLEILSDENEAM